MISSISTRITPSFRAAEGNSYNQSLSKGNDTFLTNEIEKQRYLLMHGEKLNKNTTTSAEYIFGKAENTTVERFLEKLFYEEGSLTKTTANSITEKVSDTDLEINDLANKIATTKIKIAHAVSESDKKELEKAHDLFSHFLQKKSMQQAGNKSLKAFLETAKDGILTKEAYIKHLAQIENLEKEVFTDNNLNKLENSAKKSSSGFKKILATSGIAGVGIIAGYILNAITPPKNSNKTNTPQYTRIA
jgi:hypothetical protein